MKSSLELVTTLTTSVILTPKLIFLFFWSRPSDLSFKLRKRHFPQFGSLKIFHLPLQVIVQEWSNHKLELQGQLESHMNNHIGRSYYHKPENAQSWKKSASLCTHIIFKKERTIWRRLRFDHQKSAQWKQWWIMSTRIQITRCFKEMGCQFSFPFWTPHYKRTIF